MYRLVSQLELDFHKKTCQPTHQSWLLEVETCHQLSPMSGWLVLGSAQMAVLGSWFWNWLNPLDLADSYVPTENSAIPMYRLVSQLELDFHKKTCQPTHQSWLLEVETCHQLSPMSGWLVLGSAKWLCWVLGSSGQPY